MKFVSEITKGIIRDNPIFVLVLGMCPTLAVSTSVKKWDWDGTGCHFRAHLFPDHYLSCSKSHSSQDPDPSPI